MSVSHITRYIEKLEGFRGDKVRFGDLVDRFQEEGFPVTLLLISVPLALPLPAPPPLNFIFGIPLLFLNAQMALGLRKPYFPRWIRNRKIPRNYLDRAAQRGRKWAERSHRFVRPRWRFVFTGPDQQIIGLCAVIMSLSIFVPYPASNTVPSFFMAMAAFGKINEDGVITLIGIAGGLSWVLLIAAIGIAVWIGAIKIF